jgi:GxxExxY protein
MRPMSQRSVKGYNFDDGTYQVIGACIEVHRRLGPGFREIIYQRALSLELMAAGLEHSREAWIDVHYRDRVIGRHRVDFVVGQVMLEIKAKSDLPREDYVQAVSYLKASQYRLGLLIKFGKERIEVHRLLCDQPPQRVDIEP